MTKSVAAALILVGLTLAILVVWFFGPPASNLVNIGAEHEKSQSAAMDSSVSSSLEGADTTVELSVTGPNSLNSVSNDSFERTASATRSAALSQAMRPASADQDDENADGLAISGLVQDEEGYPLANIEVIVEPIRFFNADETETDPTLLEARSTFTDYDGYYKFEDLVDGEYNVHTVAELGLASAKISARAGTTSANLMPAWLREFQVSGLVKSTDESPLEAVRVTSGSPVVKTHTDPGGFYEINVSFKAKAEKHVFNFKRKGFRDQQVSLDSVDLEGAFNDISLDVTMEPLKGLTTVTGRIQDSNGRSVVQQVVYLRSRRLKSSYAAYSDKNGLFAVKDVQPGKDYNLLVPPTTDFRVYEKSQLLIPESGLELQIVLEPLNRGELFGWMTDPDGQPIPQFTMTLQSKIATGKSVQVVGDHTGYFAVTDFPEGSAVLITNSYPVFEVQGISVTQKAEEPIPVVLDLGSHRFVGQVTNLFGDAVAAAEVSLAWQLSMNGVQNRSARKTVADQNGYFEFTGLGAGVHTLRVKAHGFKMGVVNIDAGMTHGNIVVELEEKT